MSFLLDTDHLSTHLRRPSGLAHRFFQYAGRPYTPSIALTGRGRMDGAAPFRTPRGMNSCQNW